MSPGPGREGRRRVPAPSPERQVEVGVVSRRVVRIEALPPDVLERLNEVIPGSARELLDNTLAESVHRREMDRQVVATNIETQRRKMDAVRFQAWRSVYGQTIGLLVCLACIGGAVWLASLHPEAWQVPVALAAIPTAAVIRAFILAPGGGKEEKPRPTAPDGENGSTNS